MWVSTHVGVNGHRKAELVILSVEVIEMISPQIFNVSWVYPTVRVRRLFDEHHRWQLLLTGKSGANTEWQDPCRAGNLSYVMALDPTELWAREGISRNTHIIQVPI